MNAIKKYFAPFISGVLLLSLSSCASPPSNRESNDASLPVTETINPLPTTQPDNTPSTSQSDKVASTPAEPQKPSSAPALSLNARGTKETAIAQSAKTITLNVYQADSQCQTLVPEKVSVPAETPVNAAVGKVLEKAASGDLDLAGYRVSINPKTRIATVDLRLSPDSQRQFLSLSTCEQFALFGSLRKTLLDNPQLQITGIRFTDQGQEIYL